MSVKIYKNNQWIETAGQPDTYTKIESDSRFAQKATTLAGYGITDAYTKTESDAKYVPKISSTSLGLTFASGWSSDTSGGRYINRCYKITDNLYYICIFIKNSAAMTAGTSYTAFNEGGLTVDGKVPQVCTVSCVNRENTQSAVGCWINYAGKVYVTPTTAVPAGSGICIAGIVHIPS